MSKINFLILGIISASVSFSISSVQAMGAKKPAAGVGETDREGRVLVMGVDLVDENQKWFGRKISYPLTEAIGIQMTFDTLLDDYASIRVLTHENATFDKVMSELERQNNRPEISAVDFIAHFHGADDEFMREFKETKDGILAFRDGYKWGSEIANALQQMTWNSGVNKLRMFYTDACFSYSISEHMINGGFSVSDGAIGLDADGLTAYPAFLKRWAKGKTYREGIVAGNRNPIGSFIDWVGGSKSDKIISGNSETTIVSQGTKAIVEPGVPIRVIDHKEKATGEIHEAFLAFASPDEGVFVEDLPLTASEPGEPVSEDHNGHRPRDGRGANVR